MSNYNILKTNIAAQIKQNGAKAITGQILQTHLLSMITSLGAGYQYMGVAALNTNPGTPDYKCFYIATAVGTYSNFGSPALTVAAGEVAIFYYDTAWHKAVTGAASKADVDALIQTLEGEVSELGQKVDDLDVAINGQYFTQPVAAQSGGYMGASGAWVVAAGYYYVTINVVGVRGLHISGNASQYAFLKSFSNDASTPSVFVSGGSRVSGALSNVEIPSDANILYILYGTTEPTTFNYTFSETLSSGLVADVANLENDVADLSDDIDSIIAEQTESNLTINISSPKLEFVPNCYAGQNGLQSSGQYHSWVFYAPNDFQIYMSSIGSGTYMQLCVYPSGEFGDANYVRYRNSDGNLPSSGSPLSVTAGTMLIISTDQNNSTWSYIISAWITTKLSNKIYLNTKQLEQVGLISVSYNSGVLAVDGGGVSCKFSDLDFNNAHGVFELQNLDYNGKTIFGTENDYLGPIRIHGESIKGAKHGSELTDSVRIFADGVELQDGNSVSARSVMIYVTSTISTDEFSRTTCWSFNGKSLLCSSVLKTLKSLNIDYVFGTGIISSVDANTIAWLNKEVLTTEVLTGLNESTMIVTTAGNLLSRRLSVNSGYGDHRVSFFVYTGRKKLYYYTCYGSDIAVPSGSVFASSAELVFS